MADFFSRNGAEGGSVLGRPADRLEDRLEVGEIIRFIIGPIAPVNRVSVFNLGTEYGYDIKHDRNPHRN